METKDQAELNLHPKGLTGDRTEQSVPIVDNSIFILAILLCVFEEAFE